MSIFSSFAKAISQTFDAVGSTAQSVEKTVDILNIYVDNNHKRITKIVRQDAILSTAQHHLDIAKELDSDADLKAQFTALEADW